MLVGSNFVSQIITISLLPFITRLYSPSEIGKVEVIMSWVAIIATVSMLKMEVAIPVAEDTDVGFINSISVLLLLLFSTFSWIYNPAHVSPFYYIFSTFMIGLYNLLYNNSLRNKSYHNMSKSKVINSIVGNSIQVFGAFVPARFFFLFMGRTFVGSAGAICLIKDFKLNKFRNLKEMKLILAKYKKFPLLLTPSTLLNSAGLTLPILIINSMFGKEISGQYSLAFRAVSFPVSLLTASLSQVIYAEASSYYKNGEKEKIRKITLKTILSMLILGGLLGTFLMIFGPKLFETIFGSKWKLAGELSQAMGLILIVRMAANPINLPIPTIYNKQNIVLVLDILRFLLVVLSFAISYFAKLDIIKTIWLFSISMFIVYTTTILVVINIVYKNK